MLDQTKNNHIFRKGFCSIGRTEKNVQGKKKKDVTVEIKMQLLITIEFHKSLIQITPSGAVLNFIEITFELNGLI